MSAIWQHLSAIVLALLLGIPSAAQTSGVLVAIAGTTTDESDTQDFDKIHAPEYKTLWIAPDVTGSLKVLATFPEIVVPRQDGFWHVGVKQLCDFEDDPETGGNESVGQIVWAAPVTKPAVVEQGTPCTKHDPSDYAGPYNRSEANMKKISQCGFTLVDIGYVSPQIISVRTHTGQSEDCEPRGGRYNVSYHVRKFDSDEAVTFGNLLGPKAREAYFQALPKQAEDDAGEECGEPGNDDTGWRVATHEYGNYYPALHQDLGYFGCSADVVLRMPLPASITGDPPARIDWKVLRSKIGKDAGAYVSPSGDLVMVVTKEKIRFNQLHASIPGKLLLELPGARAITMVQWASGSHVQDWTRDLGKLSKSPLPAPEIRVKTAGSGQ